jgi:hypothetical protein
MGRRFIEQSHQSTVIKEDPNYKGYQPIGYDGQFYYYIALDPLNARYYMDQSAFRYTRILYPLVARALALGQADLIPYTLILVNLLAIPAGTLLLAAWLRRRGVSPWFAIVYGLYPGLFISFQRDLTEPLAYALVALGVYLYDFAGSRRWLLAAVAFALAALTREATAVFAVVYGAAILFQGTRGTAIRERLKARWRPAALFAAIAFGPFVLYKLFLIASLGRGADVAISQVLVLVPFGGLLHWRYWEPQGQVDEIRTVVIPGIIVGAVAVWALFKRLWRVEIVALLANVIPFVVFLNADAYVEIRASARVTTGVVLAALLCLPVLDRWLKSRAWFYTSAALWLSMVPFWLLFPTGHYFLHLVRS